MPEPRAMATPQVLRKKDAKHHKPLASPKLFFSRAFTILGLVFLAAASPTPALACSVCFGETDSEMAQGLNAGVLALFLIVLSVLVGFAAFFIFIARRSAAASRAQLAGAQGLSFPDEKDGGELVLKD